MKVDGEVVDGVTPKGKFPVQKVALPVFDNHVFAVDVRVDAYQRPPGERGPGRFDDLERIGGKPESLKLWSVLITVGRMDLLGQLG